MVDHGGRGRRPRAVVSRTSGEPLRRRASVLIRSRKTSSGYCPSSVPVQRGRPAPPGSSSGRVRGGVRRAQRPRVPPIRLWAARSPSPRRAVRVQVHAAGERRPLPRGRGPAAGSRPTPRGGRRPSGRRGRPGWAEPGQARTAATAAATSWPCRASRRRDVGPAVLDHRDVVAGVGEGLGLAAGRGPGRSPAARSPRGRRRRSVDARRRAAGRRTS